MRRGISNIDCMFNCCCAGMDEWIINRMDAMIDFNFHHLVNGGGFWYFNAGDVDTDITIVKNWDPNGSEFTWGVKLSRSEIKIRRHDRN